MKVSEQQAALETELRDSMDKYGIPEYMHDGVILYIVHGIRPGDFLSALFSNDLMESFGLADAHNTLAMHSWVKWIYNEAPATCHGSPGQVEKWLSVTRSPEAMRRCERNANEHSTD